MVRAASLKLSAGAVYTELHKLNHFNLKDRGKCMKKSILYLTVLFLALGLQACPKKEKKEEGAAPSAGTTAGGGQIGVPECDDYITKIQKCVDEHVPEAAKGMMKQGFDQNIAAWKQAAATPEGKQGLANACQMAMDAAKQSMGAYGCTF
jgi:hypothetical protein